MSELASAKSVSNNDESPPPDDQETELESYLRPLSIDDALIHSLAYEFSKVYKEVAIQSDEQFLPTPVTELPTGKETGQFLAIDVGGTNLRVAFIELLGDADDKFSTTNGEERSRETIRNAQRPRVRRTLEKAWPIGEHLKIDKTEDLFAWIGDCIAEVVGDRLGSEVGRVDVPDELAMGITFSFPMKYVVVTQRRVAPLAYPSQAR
jgi:hexokinase